MSISEQCIHQKLGWAIKASIVLIPFSLVNFTYPFWQSAIGVVHIISTSSILITKAHQNKFRSYAQLPRLILYDKKAISQNTLIKWLQITALMIPSSFSGFQRVFHDYQQAAPHKGIQEEEEIAVWITFVGAVGQVFYVAQLICYLSLFSHLYNYNKCLYILPSEVKVLLLSTYLMSTVRKGWTIWYLKNCFVTCEIVKVFRFVADIIVGDSFVKEFQLTLATQQTKTISLDSNLIQTVILTQPCALINSGLI